MKNHREYPLNFSQNLENFRFSGFCPFLYNSFGDHFFKTLKTRGGGVSGPNGADKKSLFFMKFSTFLDEQTMLMGLMGMS